MLLGKKIGIDVATTMARAVVRGEGLVLEEPSVVALAKAGATISAFGRKAEELVAGDDAFRLVRPVDGAQITDPGALVALITHIVNRVAGRQRIFKPDIVVAVHSNMSGDHRRVVLDALARANTRTSYLLDMPVAAGLGAGMSMSGSNGHMVVDIGKRCAELAVVAGGGTVSSRAFTVGDLEDEEGESDRLALIKELVNAGREVMAEIAQSLVTDIRHEGAVLVGGGPAMIENLEQQLSQAWGIDVHVVNNPHLCAVHGAQIDVDSLDLLKRTFMYIR